MGKGLLRLIRTKKDLSILQFSLCRNLRHPPLPFLPKMEYDFLRTLPDNAAECLPAELDFADGKPTLSDCREADCAPKY